MKKFINSSIQGVFASPNTASTTRTCINTSHHQQCLNALINSSFNNLAIGISQHQQQTFSSSLINNSYNNNNNNRNTRNFNDNRPGKKTESSNIVRRDYKPLTLLEPPVEQSIEQQQYTKRDENDFIHGPSSEKSNLFSFHFEPELVKAMEEMNISSPSNIQELAITQLLQKKNRKKHFCIGAQTGTGKTLSYLLPVLKKMKHLETVKGMETQIKKPKFLIVAPTRELATQIYKTTKFVSHYMKFRAVLLRSDLPKSRMKRDLNTKCDVVITTPQIFTKMHDDGHVYFSDVRFVVLDEADTLCAKDFLPDLEKIAIPCIERAKHVREFVQFGFVFATYNANVERFLSHYFGESPTNTTTNGTVDQSTMDLDKNGHAEEEEDSISTSKLLYLIDRDMHKTQAHIKQRFITLNANNQDKLKYLVERVLRLKSNVGREINKNSILEEGVADTTSIKNPALLESLSDQGSQYGDEGVGDGYFTNKVKIVNFGPKTTDNNRISVNLERVLIFCNTVKSCRAVHHTLTEAGLEAACFHGEMMAPKQSEEFDAFSTGRVRVMVTTDIAARGLDLISPVDHVVLFDFPLNSIDYMHRVGRTGRMGAEGRVTCLLNRKMETELAKAVQYAMVTNQPLTTINVENASENYERMKYEQAQKRQLKRHSYEKRFRNTGNNSSGNRGYYGRESFDGPISISNPTRMTKHSSSKKYY